MRSLQAKHGVLLAAMFGLGLAAMGLAVISYRTEWIGSPLDMENKVRPLPGQKKDGIAETGKLDSVAGEKSFVADTASESVQGASLQAVIPLEYPGIVLAVAFSPDGSLALSGDMGTTLKLWEVATGRESRTLKGHSDSVRAVAFSPDGQLILSGSQDDTLKLWEVATGRVLRTLKGHSGFVTSAAFSPDGKLILSGSQDDTLKLWEVATARESRTLKGHSDSVRAVAFSPDGQLILSGSGGFDIEFEGRSYEVEVIDITSSSPDIRLEIPSASIERTLKLWQVATGQEVRTFQGHSAAIHSIAFSPDSRLALSGSLDDILRLWDVTTGRQIRNFKGHSDNVRAVAFSPDGRLALSGSNDATLKLWEVATGQALRTFRGHSDDVYVVAFSPDGRLALSGSMDRTLKLWEVATGQALRTLRGHAYGVNAAAFSPDGQLILSGSWDDTLMLWKVPTGRKLRAFRGSDSVTAIAFSPDGRLVLSGVRDDTLTLWEVATGRKLHTLRGHAYVVNTVAFSPDGRLALSGGMDRTLKLWEVATGRELRIFQGHFSGIEAALFSPDGRLIVSGSEDGTVRMWDVETGEEIVKMVATRDGEWIAATHDGYYDSSPEGNEGIYWVANPGAESYSFEQFESRFRKPEIIQARLAGDLNAGKPAPVLTVPPSVELPEHGRVRQTRATGYPLQLTARALKAVKSVRVFVNGKPTLEESVNAREKALSLEVPLFPGANRLTAIAFDERGFSSNPRYVDVVSDQAGQAKPNLYVLSVGVSRYPRLSPSDQLAFAHTDAEGLVAALKPQERKLFEHVYTHVLTNEAVTPAAVVERLDALSAIGKDDLAVIFLAGHGVQNKVGHFYFLTSEGSLAEPAQGGIDWTVLGERLARIPGRVILLLDACRSGGLVTETVVPNDELARQFFTRGGGVMVFSASKGRQPSYEPKEGAGGVFTHALTRGLGPEAKKADANGNGFVEFMELVEYVRGTVDRQMEGRQTPWLSRKELFGDLPIARVN